MRGKYACIFTCVSKGRCETKNIAKQTRGTWLKMELRATYQKWQNQPLQNNKWGCELQWN